MRLLIAVLLLGFVAVSAYNWLEIQALRAEVQRLSRDRAVAGDAAPSADGTAGSLVDELTGVRESIARGDWDRARRDLDAARTRIDAAAEKASRSAKPVVDWVGRQARELEAQIEKQKQSGR